MHARSPRYRRWTLAINAGIVAVLALTAALIWQRRAPRRTATPSSQALVRPTVPAPGARVALPAKGGPQRTLLIAVRKGCPACDADAASLRVLKARAEAGQVPVRILVPDRSSLDDAYLGRFGGAAGDATLVSFAELGIGAVPAVIEVGPDSVVTRSWMGRVEKQLAQWTF